MSESSQNSRVHPLTNAPAEVVLAMMIEAFTFDLPQDKEIYWKFSDRAKTPGHITAISLRAIRGDCCSSFNRDCTIYKFRQLCERQTTCITYRPSETLCRADALNPLLLSCLTTVLILGSDRSNSSEHLVQDAQIRIRCTQTASLIFPYIFQPR